MFNGKGFVKMYAPNGAEVYLPFDPARIRRLMAEYERQGLTPTPPNEYERERRDRVGAFVVRSHINGDGSETPVVDVYIRHRNGYTDRLRSLRVYLNTDRDRSKFEAAFGVSLDAIEIYSNDKPLERGKRPDQEKYIYQPQHPVWVIWRLNPASEKDENAPKRLFVRWEAAGNGQRRQQQSKPQQQQQQPNPQPKPEPKPQPEPQTAAQTTAKDAEADDDPLADVKQPISALVIVDTVAKVWNVERGEAAKALHKAFDRGVKISVREAREWALAQM